WELGFSRSDSRWLPGSRVRRNPLENSGYLELSTCDPSPRPSFEAREELAGSTRKRIDEIEGGTQLRDLGANGRGILQVGHPEREKLVDQLRYAPPSPLRGHSRVSLSPAFEPRPTGASQLFRP